MFIPHYSVNLNKCCLKPHTKEPLQLQLNLEKWHMGVLHLGVSTAMSTGGKTMALTLLTAFCLIKEVISVSTHYTLHLETPSAILSLQ